MRLFSLPGSSLAQKRAWLLTTPFDLAPAAPVVPNRVGGVWSSPDPGRVWAGPDPGRTWGARP